MSEYRKLENEEIILVGDSVTIGETEESGFRHFTGRIGVTAGTYFYPIYREWREQTYIQITDCDHGQKLTISLEEAKTVLDNMVESSEDGHEEAYTFKTVSMTEPEFKNLPEFLGF